LFFHLSDPQEESFDFKRETQFVDSETGEKIPSLLANPQGILGQLRCVYSVSEKRVP
jgi:hypothetical protein